MGREVGTAAKLGNRLLAAVSSTALLLRHIFSRARAHAFVVVHCRPRQLLTSLNPCWAKNLTCQFRPWMTLGR